jgi:hypothetical protein
MDSTVAFMLISLFKPACEIGEYNFLLSKQRCGTFRLLQKYCEKMARLNSSQHTCHFKSHQVTPVVGRKRDKLLQLYVGKECDACVLCTAIVDL